MLLAVGGMSLAASIVVLFTVPYPRGALVAHAWVWGAVVPGYLVGAFAVTARPDHLSARWLGRAGSLLAIETVARRLIPLAGDLEVAWWVAGSIFVQGATLATATAVASVLIVFPDQSYRYPYQRRVLWGVWLAAAAVPLMLAVSQPSLFFPMAWRGPAVTNPLYVSWLEPLGPVAEAALWWRLMLWAAGVAAMVFRYRRASPDVRRQFRWPLAAGLLLTSFGVSSRLSGPGAAVSFGVMVPGYALLSASILVVILRHRLIGVALWLRRSILLGGASAVIALAYLGLAGVLGLAVGQRASLGVAVVATLAAVVAFQPARRRLDAVARRWVFGSSVAGSELLRRAGETLEDAYDAKQLTSNLAETIVAGLGLDWVRVLLNCPGSGGGWVYATLTVLVVVVMASWWCSNSMGGR